MADDLAEEWWAEEVEPEETSADAKTNLEAQKPNKSSKGKRASECSDDILKPVKRKADDADKKSGNEKKKKKKLLNSGQEKRKDRKRITDELEENLAKPGSADDVRTMMSKALKDRLGEDVIQDILPSDCDFHPHNIEGLVPSKYLTTILPNWRATLKKSIYMKKSGSPCVLIITSSAIRAVELNRLIKDFVDGKCKVAKLFAKHMKVEEQKKFLSKTNCQIGIGTPGRLLLLIKQGLLQLESLVAIVLDWNWRDSKLKRLPDIPEIRHDVVHLLKDFLLETVRGSSCKLALL